MDLLFLVLLSVFLLNAFDRLLLLIHGVSVTDHPLQRILASLTMFWAWLIACCWFLSLFGILTKPIMSLTALFSIGLMHLSTPAPSPSLWQEIKTLLFQLAKAIKARKIYGYLILLVLAWFVYALMRILLLPPTNYDSLAAHLSIIANWIQYGKISIEKFSHLRIADVTYPPNAHILELWHVLLAGSGSYAGLAQLEALAICLISLFLIGKHSSLSDPWAFNSALLFMGIPIVLVQSYTTQVDLISCSAICLSATWMYIFIRKGTSGSLVLFCISLGILLGVKQIGIVAVPMFIFVFVAAQILTRREIITPKHIFCFSILLLVPILVLGAPKYFQNLLHYGALVPLAKEDFGGNVGINLSNLFRHFSKSYIQKWFVECWNLPHRSMTFHHDQGSFGPLFGYFIIPALIAGIFLCFKECHQKSRFDFLKSSPVILCIIGVLILGGYSISLSPIIWDIRESIYLPALSTPFAFWALSKLFARYHKLFGLALGVVTGITMAVAVLCDPSGNLGHVYRFISLAPSERNIFAMPGLNPGGYTNYKLLCETAKPGESILFCGGRFAHDWQYPLFGDRLERKVFFVSNLENLSEVLRKESIDWILVRVQFKDVVDFLQKHVEFFVEYGSTDITDSSFRVFKIRSARPSFFFTGIYNDYWTDKSFSLTTGVSGKFILFFRIHELLQDGIKMEIEGNGKSSLHVFERPGNHSLIQDVEKPGTIKFKLDKTFCPKERGLSQDSRTLGISILSIKFVPASSKDSLPREIQIYPPLFKTRLVEQ